MLQGSDRDIWMRSLSNEWGRSARGNKHGVQHTNTIEFISKNDVPNNRDVTHASFVLDCRPLKTEPYRVRIVVGGDRSSHPLDAGSPATDMMETKLLINSTISDAHKGARFLTADIKDYFLATPMQREEHMKVKYKYFPPDIREYYNLHELVDNDCICIRINKGMCGLKQAAMLAHDNLKQSLEPHGCTPVQGTVGLWKHKTRKTKFCLCVDDFGIKYFNREDADHLLNTLRKCYKMTVDKKGENYCGLALDWNYDDGHVDISMPGCVTKSLKRLQHVPKKAPQYSPHDHVPIQCGTKERQLATAPDTAPLLDKKGTTHVQSTSGTFLH